MKKIISEAFIVVLFLTLGSRYVHASGVSHRPLTKPDPCKLDAKSEDCKKQKESESSKK